MTGARRTGDGDASGGPAAARRAKAPSGVPSPVGFFGGTFDPIHYGHLRLAEEMACALGLEQVVFVPSAQPPHRDAPQVAAADRLEMVRRAIAGNPRFSVDGRELDRPGPSYSVDTLASLRTEWGSARAVWMLLGGDAFHGLPTWHAWRRLFDLVNIAVVTRPSAPAVAVEALPAALGDEVRARLVPAGAAAGAAGAVRFVPMTALDISATALRAALAARRSVRYLLPDAVLNYLDEHQLYRPT